MDDYWTDAARPPRRNWWELEPEADEQPRYPPIGLEAFRPDPPPAIGFNVQPPQPEPLEQFAKSWLPSEAPAEPSQSRVRSNDPPNSWFDTPGSMAPRWLQHAPKEPWLAPIPDEPSESVAARGDTDTKGQTSVELPNPTIPLGAFVLPSSGLAALTGGAAGAAGTTAAAAAGEAVLPAAASVGGGLAAGTAAIAAPLAAGTMMVASTNSQGEGIPLGDGRRLAWRPGELRFRVERGNGGLFGSGIWESWTDTKEDVRDALLSHPKLDLPSIRRAFGEEGVALALRAIHGPEAGPREKHVGAQGPKQRDDYLSRRILAEYADLIKRDTDQWSVEGVVLNEGELDHEATCIGIQKRPGEEASNSNYVGPDAVPTKFQLGDSDDFLGTSPKVGDPADGRTSIPPDTRHQAGLRGEIEMTNRIHGVMPSEHVAYFGNPRGINGPDGISISDNFRRVMLYDSKYSGEPRSVGPRDAVITPGAQKHVVQRLLQARDAGRVPQDVVDAALRQYSDGNFSICTVGTGEARNGYITHFRNGRPIVVRRIKQ